MRVYIVLNGECNEGGGVVTVRKTYESAECAALATETHFGGGWKRDDPTYSYWTNGCDFVQVVEEEVLE